MVFTSSHSQGNSYSFNVSGLICFRCTLTIAGLLKSLVLIFVDVPCPCFIPIFNIFSINAKLLLHSLSRFLVFLFLLLFFLLLFLLLCSIILCDCVLLQLLYPLF